LKKENKSNSELLGTWLGSENRVEQEYRIDELVCKECKTKRSKAKRNKAQHGDSHCKHERVAPCAFSRGRVMKVAVTGPTVRDTDD
jgi:hypothetical protein